MTIVEKYKIGDYIRFTYKKDLLNCGNILILKVIGLTQGVIVRVEVIDIIGNVKGINVGDTGKLTFDYDLGTYEKLKVHERVVYEL